jgi:hypothetical protein
MPTVQATTAGFASAAAFTGSGIGSYTDAGYDEQGQPAIKVTACVYTTPYPATTRVQSAYNRYVSRAQARRLTDPRAGVAASAGASASACKLAPLQSGPVSGETPGTLIDDSAVPVINDSSRPTAGAGRALAPMIAAPNHSDEVIGNDQPGEKIYSGTGGFDLVRMGDGNHDSVFGGAGDNLISVAAAQTTTSSEALVLTRFMPGAATTTSCRTQTVTPCSSPARAGIRSSGTICAGRWSADRALTR